jgi:hypothetical protein
LKKIALNINLNVNGSTLLVQLFRRLFLNNVFGIVNSDSDFISHVDEIIKENDYILYDLEKEISLEDSIITIKIINDNQ